jgi:hypothetical protein
MLARKLPYFNTKTLTLNLANLELGEGLETLAMLVSLWDEGGGSPWQVLL